MEPKITIAILAKDKAHVLPLYLKCIYDLQYPKDKICLYIRTNDNNDKTEDILFSWLEKHKNEYADYFFERSSVDEEIKKYGQHEWNTQRFKVLGRIRQDSIRYAIDHGTCYFVVDCDNFILPHTLRMLVNLNLPVVAPMLPRIDQNYANYHFKTDDNGYFAECQEYYDVRNYNIVGIIRVNVVHCTYLIRNETLSHVSYDDNSGRHEYVIFSSRLRWLNIPQFIDNRENYGQLVFAENVEELDQIKWIHNRLAESYSEIRSSEIRNDIKDIMTVPEKSTYSGPTGISLANDSQVPVEDVMTGREEELLIKMNALLVSINKSGKANDLSSTDKEMISKMGESMVKLFGPTGTNM